MFDSMAVFDAIGGKLPRSIWEMDNVPIGTYYGVRKLLEQSYIIDTRIVNNRVSIMIHNYISPEDALRWSEYEPNVVKYQS